MDEISLRLECLKLTSGDLDRAHKFYSWIIGDAVASLLISAKMIERELIRMTGVACSVTEGADNLFLVAIGAKAKAIRFSQSERSLSMTDFNDQVLKPLVASFAG